MLTIHGHERAYRMCGSGPALLLVHGIGDSSDGWVSLMGELSRDHTVLAPDLLGHGASAKPRADYSVAAYANGMRDLLDALELERATVVGHSLGGGVAAQLAYQYPERCERLVLVSSGGVGPEVNPALRLASLPLAELALWPLALPPTRAAAGLLVQALAALGHDLGRDAAQVRRVLDGLPEAAARGAFSRTLRSVVDWRGQVVTMRDRAYLCADVPVLLVWGDRDAVIPVEHARLAQQAMPAAQLEVFEGTGHFPHHDEPERFLEVLRDFVERTEPSRHDPSRRRSALRRGAAVQLV